MAANAPTLDPLRADHTDVVHIAADVINDEAHSSHTTAPPKSGGAGKAGLEEAASSLAPISKSGAATRSVPGTPLDVAGGYVNRQWSPIPVPFRAKAPQLSGWQNLRLDAGSITDYFGTERMNIGVLLGEPSNWLIDIDLDCTQAVMLAPRFLPDTLTFGRAGKPKSHWLYRCEDVATLKFQDGNRGMLLEIRSTGVQTVFPGSVHPSGDEIKFDGGHEPLELPAPELLRSVNRLAAASLLATHWPHGQGRHDFSLALSRVLLDSGWTIEEAERFIDAVADVAGDEETADRVRCVEYTASRLAEGQPATGFPTMAEAIGKEVAERFVKWLGVKPSLPSWVEEMNARYFVVNENGKAAVYQTQTDKSEGREVLVRYTFKDLGELHQHERVQIGLQGEKPKFMSKGKAWLEHPARKTYLGGVVFEPSGPVPDDAFNLWRGLAVEPKAGNWNLMRAHLREVVCSGNDEHFEYLMNWCARLLQQPGTPGEVAVILRGGRGSGKGTVGNALKRIFGQHGLYITNGKHLTGNFNAHLRDAVFLFVDEAFFAGDRQHESVLKGLITEPYITIEAKYQNACTVRNCAHLLMASNERWVVPAGIDERRFFVLDVSDVRQQDHEYFEALHAELGSGGLEAMAHELLERDISKFNVRDMPVTGALIDQKIASLRGVEAWLYSALMSGCMNRGSLGIGFNQSWGVDGLEIAISEAYAGYATKHRDFKEYTPADRGQWSKIIQRVLSDAVVQRRPRQSPGARPQVWPYYGSPAGSEPRPRVLSFAPLDVCRKKFEDFLGGAIDWEPASLEEDEDRADCEVGATLAKVPMVHPAQVVQGQENIN